jgi:hypothetical protein
MNAKWEKRRNGYFAYAHHSWREGGKTKTYNKYLGSDIKTAVGKLQEFCRELNITPVQINDLEQFLIKQGHELGVRANDLPYDNKEFINKFQSQFFALADFALVATTTKSRKELSSEIKMLGGQIMAYINSEKRSR